MEFLTPELFDTFIISVLMIGLALAVVRFYRDMTRPRRRQNTPAHTEDTQPNRTKQQQGASKPSLSQVSTTDHQV